MNMGFIMNVVILLVGLVIGFLAWTALLGVLVIRLPIMNRFYRHQKHIPHHKPYMAVSLLPAVLIFAIIAVPSFFWPWFFYGQLAGLIINFANWKNIVEENHKSLMAQEPGIEEFINQRK